MDLISHLLPSQAGLSLQRWDLDTTTQQVTVYLASTQTSALCPRCQCPSHRIHSHYERTLKDLPVVQFSLALVLTVSKFFCLNNACAQRIFTERLPEIVAPWARRTVRYGNHLTAMALALGGAAGARLSDQMGYDHSRNSMLRVVEAVPLPIANTPRILGVDDFALSKGHHYGTILVDLEQRQPIALLPDRTAETLATWLKDHPGVDILSRDRSKTYKRGMSQGAPDAIQVADRFHLLHNLEETLETAFKGHNAVLKQVEKDTLQVDGLAVLLSLELPENLQSPKALNRARRLDKYEQTHALRQQGYAIKDIAHHLGIGKRTVYKYLAASSFPERQPTIRQQGSGLDAYKPYIQDQWNRGQRQTKALFHEIQQQGYPGSYSTLARYTHQLQQLTASNKPDPELLNALPGRGPAPTLPTSPQKPLSARRAAWLILQRAETRTTEENSLITRLAQQPELSGAITLAQDFIDLIRQRLPTQLDAWLQAAKASSIKAFQSFAKGLEEDYDAVKAGMTLEVSNGPVEGQNNRLKMLKRQMFGRANLELLEKRFILTS